MTSPRVTLELVKKVVSRFPPSAPPPPSRTALALRAEAEPLLPAGWHGHLLKLNRTDEL